MRLRFSWFPRKQCECIIARSLAENANASTFLLFPSRPLLKMRIYKYYCWFPRAQCECINVCVGSLAENDNVLMFVLVPSQKKRMY